MSKWYLCSFSQLGISLLSEAILSFTLLADWKLLPLLLVLLLPLEFFTIARCMIRTGIPPKSKSSFKELVKNLRSVSESCAFPLTKATKVGGRAFTWVKYLIFGWLALSFQECLLITWSKQTGNHPCVSTHYLFIFYLQREEISQNKKEIQVRVDEDVPQGTRTKPSPKNKDQSLQDQKHWLKKPQNKSKDQYS